VRERDGALWLLRRDADRDEPEAPREPSSPPAEPVASAETDAVESVWDPWLVALARVKALEEQRPN
jgi:hypothetical protein